MKSFFSPSPKSRLALSFLSLLLLPLVMLTLRFVDARARWRKL